MLQWERKKKITLGKNTTKNTRQPFILIIKWNVAEQQMQRRVVFLVFQQFPKAMRHPLRRIPENSKSFPSCIPQYAFLASVWYRVAPNCTENKQKTNHMRACVYVYEIGCMCGTKKGVGWVNAIAMCRQWPSPCRVINQSRRTKRFLSCRSHWVKG